MESWFFSHLMPLDDAVVHNYTANIVCQCVIQLVERECSGTINIMVERYNPI